MPLGRSRRDVLKSIAAVGMAATQFPRAAFTQSTPQPILRSIPATGERLPAVGMGSWITFNVGRDRRLRDARAEVLRRFFARGGTVIDSSPMYGSSEAVIGYGLRKLGHTEPLFSATKVWTPFKGFGPGQMAESRGLWGVERFDLMQIHNLLNWEGHLETLIEDKEHGRLRHIGIATSHGSRHDEMIRVMQQKPVVSVQFTYNILDREAERRLLPAAAERSLAVMINRPFRRGHLFDLFARHRLPDWAVEIDCRNWAQFFLKFIVSHPAVTCVIPATSRVDHMEENMGALYGALPDAAMRARMVRYVESL